MKTYLRDFLVYAIPFSILFFIINYFIPFFRSERSIGSLIFRSIIIAVFYGIIMTLLKYRKQKKNEK